jgi:hypothetical protein
MPVTMTTSAGCDATAALCVAIPLNGDDDREHDSEHDSEHDKCRPRRSAIFWRGWVATTRRAPCSPAMPAADCDVWGARA